MKKDKYKIKQCNCGGTPRILISWMPTGFGLLQFSNGFYVACPGCGEMTEFKGTKQSTVNIWNRKVERER